jgi:endo-1,4-beta-D-glucanase Y
MPQRTARYAGYFAIVIAVIAIALGVYLGVRQKVPLIFSPHDMLTSIWGKYKSRYLEEGTSRTVDTQRGNVTTSEGEGYTMLRAVWLDDRQTFDASWKWTKDNLQQRKTDHLFSWLFGKRPDGSYGILTAQNGQNTASDADTDIALALAFGYARWQDPSYLTSAKEIINDIWAQEVINIKGKPYLAADNVEKNYTDNIVVNPSYFAPYAYRIFARIDPSHDWNGLIDTSYDVLERSMVQKLDGKGPSANIPPNWISLGRKDGSIQAPGASKPGLDTNYGFDALRVSWRVALDLYWNQEPRAKKILSSMGFLDTEWKARQIIHDIYAHDGTVIDFSEAPSMYGASLPALVAVDGADADAAYKTKLVALYNPDTQDWNRVLSYYDDNWAWFGMALYNNELPNLWNNE